MARPWRIQFPDAVYHVTARGNNRQAIFRDDHDRQDFLGLIARGQPRFNLHLFAFCLMNNHYHLFLRTPEPNLSSALQWLNATYTLRFHRRHRGNGHLFQGRFKAALVVSEAHWLHLSMYIHLNPVRAGLVDDPADYAWSSFTDYLRPRPRFPWLRPEDILSHYGQTPAERRRRYRRACLALAGKPGSFWREFKTGAVLGPREVWEELAKKYRPEGQAAAVPEFIRATRVKAEPAAERERVAQAFGVTVADLARKRRDFPPRLALSYHLVENCGLPVTSVAAFLNLRASSVSMGVKTFKNKMENHKKLQALMKPLNFK
jgi:REP element-mobilizing transposase RayT